jgi:glycosyltransferase involved in cell wall biosynthesis
VTTASARRIALVCDWCLPRFGGLELQLMDVARALRAAGHTVEIITATPGPTVLDGVPVHRLRGARMPHFGITCSPTQFREFRTVLREGAFDVVHVHSGLIAPLAYGCAAIAARAGVPTALTFHSVYDYLLPALSALAHVSGAAQLPIAWSAVSRYVAREASHALAGATVAVLPNGIDPDQWHVVPLPRPVGEFRLVSVMRLQVRKRPLALFDILDRAQREAGPSVRLSLDIVGEGRERAAVERRARARDDGRVRVHGRLTHEEIRAVFGGADAFLLPTRLESFGIAALEARCAGLPVIARQDSGVEDFITHGHHGLLGDSDASLASAVARLALDEPLRAAMAARNRESTPPHRWTDVVAATMAQFDRAERLQAPASARVSSCTTRPDWS